MVGGVVVGFCVNLGFFISSSFIVGNVRGRENEEGDVEGW